MDNCERLLPTDHTFIRVFPFGPYVQWTGTVCTTLKGGSPKEQSGEVLSNLCKWLSFKGFPYITLCKIGDPRGGANFDPGDMICTTLVEDH